MDTEVVIEFLGCVPLLQRLPSSSLKKIAQLVTLKHFESGDYVVREGKASAGIYFIWEGEAKVSGLDKTDDHNRPEFQLKRYDYFGHGFAASAQHADVIARTKLICLVLPHELCNLMQPTSIWSADATLEPCTLVEKILHLEPLAVNIFEGITSPEAPKSASVFGGQFLGQALAAASKTVHFLKIVHSLHSHFIIAGDIHIPIIYQVHRLHDGDSFATRRVDALQQEKVVFSLVASFQEEGGEFDHQESTMPSMPNPEVLPSIEELLKRHERTGLKKVATSDFQWPTEIRLCEHSLPTSQTQGPPRLRYWFRAKGKLSEDQALHRCVAAYASDLMFLIVILSPHRRKGLELTCTSLEHSMWFHRPFKADEWLLYVIDSPSTNYARGLVRGQMFNRKGELLVSVMQVGVIREARRPASTVAAAKL